MPCPTIAAALDARFVSALKDTRIKAAEILRGPQEIPQIDRGQLLDDLRQVRGRWGETWGEKMVETCWEKRGKKRGDKPGEGGGEKGRKRRSVRVSICLSVSTIYVCTRCVIVVIYID